MEFTNRIIQLARSSDSELVNYKGSAKNVHAPPPKIQERTNIASLKPFDSSKTSLSYTNPSIVDKEKYVEVCFFDSVLRFNF